MRTNERMPWLIGLGVLAASLIGWLIPKRRKSNVERMMDWGLSSMQWMRDMGRRSGPRLIMQTGRRIVRGMLR